MLAQSKEAVLQSVRDMREALLSTAATVQYEAANEPGRQMGVESLPPEPFTERQQRQSRMDGGEEEDGTPRDYIAVAPPVEQPYIEKERNKAAAESRLLLKGAAAYRDLPLIGALAC